MRKAGENEWNDHQRENALIMFWILSTSSLRKCMEISLENLHTDIGDLRVNTIRRWGFKETEAFLRWGSKTSNELSKCLWNGVFQFSQLRDWALVTILSLPIKYKTGFFFIFQENSLKEWSFKKAITVQTYTYLHPVPVPLNIISSIVMGVVCLCKKRIGRCPCARECRGFLTPEDDQPRVSVISNPFQTLRVFLFSLFSISQVV